MDSERIRQIGQRLQWVRAGSAALAVNRRLLAGVPGGIGLSSPGFTQGGALPARYTADGAGLSPPLRWERLPEGTVSLLLLVEDPDAPFPVPLVHALAYDIAPGRGGLEEGALPVRLRGHAPEGFAMGRNFLGRTGWTPPAPPPGHGPHQYVFQLFALSAPPPFAWPPGRRFALATARASMLGLGTLTGSCQRA